MQDRTTEVEKCSNLGQLNIPWASSADIESPCERLNGEASLELAPLNNPLSPQTFDWDQWLLPVNPFFPCPSPPRQSPDEYLGWNRRPLYVDSFSRCPSPAGQCFDYKSLPCYTDNSEECIESKAGSRICQCVFHSNDCLKSICFAAARDLRCVCCRSHIDWFRDESAMPRDKLLERISYSSLRLYLKMLSILFSTQKEATTKILMANLDYNFNSNRMKFKKTSSNTQCFHWMTERMAQE